MEEHGIEKRQSGIELLKIIGMVLIVIAHVQGSVIAAGRNWDCVQSMNTATENWQYVILMMFGYFGCLGNNIFLISSAWFLCGSGRKRSNKKNVEYGVGCLDHFSDVSVAVCCTW